MRAKPRVGASTGGRGGRTARTWVRLAGNAIRNIDPGRAPPRPTRARAPTLGFARTGAKPFYRAGRMRIACPPPGASTTCSVVVASTGRCEMVTGSGLVIQFASGPSA